ncbi:MAG: hypothetical protein ACUVRZ_10085 [Desulfobacca sp.]|uniref:hypothetical protein n=1 Tax=Desulfobacca sp. TaxID=2067990 RepID=UPI00404A6D30
MEEKDLRQEPLICLVCAWRETCLKKYSFTGGQCLEFCRDVTVKLPEEKAAEQGDSSSGPK